MIRCLNCCGVACSALEFRMEPRDGTRYIAAPSVEEASIGSWNSKKTLILHATPDGVEEHAAPFRWLRMEPSASQIKKNDTSDGALRYS